MAQGKFSAQVSAWARETRARMDAVRKESAQRVIAVMQTPRSAGGNMRIDTGFLRASLQAVIGEANFTARAKPDGQAAFTYDPGQVTLIIARSKLSDPVVVVYTANYSRPREYGSRGQPGDRFVALAAQQWPRIVNEVAAEAKARAKA